jgi:S-formylglutathione hydrolase
LSVESRELLTKLVPGPVKYSVLLPVSYTVGEHTYPLLFFLHGGTGDHRILTRMAPVFRDMWTVGAAPEMVVVTPDANRSLYLDYRDGSQQWETFLVSELLPHVRSAYRIACELEATVVSGISMGGLGALRLGLKHLELFGAIVAWEPSIEPSFDWRSVRSEDRFWRSQEFMEARFGCPIDEAYWAANNPATIVREHAEAVRASGIQIYLEAGTDDAYGLHRGAEFLHRVLYDHGIKHEYRYVYGADHLGPTVIPRLRDGLTFLEKVLHPPDASPHMERFRQMIEWQKHRTMMQG